MLWVQEIKQLFRAPLRMLAFCLALATAIGLLNIAAGLSAATKRAVAEVEETYTTVGTLPRLNISQFASVEEYTDALNAVSGLAQKLAGAVKPEYRLSLENASAINVHSRLLAYNMSAVPLAVSSSEEGYSLALNKPQNLALFAVSCTDASVMREIKGYNSDGTSYIRRVYSYAFDVHEAAVIHPDLFVPDTLRIESDMVLEDRNMLFSPGHSYWVWGYYDTVTETAGELHLAGVQVTNPKTNETNLKTSRWETDRILYVCWPNERLKAYDLPIIGEYSGDAMAYLNADEVDVWGRLIEILQISISSVRICSANDIKSLHPFTNGHSYVTEGRAFTGEEIEAGQKVALISDVYAERNGLRLGDMLELSFYQTGWSAVDREQGDLYPSRIYGSNENDHEGLLPEEVSKPTSVNDGAYTIVGIYSTTGWLDDYRVIHPNTVIVPQSALYDCYGVWYYPDMTVSLSIPNGGIEAVEAELTSLGYGELLQYNDGGYSMIMPNVTSIRESAVFVCRIVTVLWVVVVLAVLILFYVVLLPAGQVKYGLGVGKQLIRKQMNFAVLPIVILSGISGGIGSFLLYERALQKMMQSDFTVFNTAFTVPSEHAEMLAQLLPMMGQETSFFVIATAVQTGILVILGTFLCAIISGRKTGWGK